MQKEDEHVLTSLTGARLLLWQGGAKKAQEALGMLEDLIDKYGATAMLLNCCATAHMLGGRYEDAEQCLKDAQTKVEVLTVLLFFFVFGCFLFFFFDKISKDPNNVNTMLALSSCYT